MPVVLTKRISEDEILAIWEITESYEEFEERLHRTPWIDNGQEGTIHPIKKLEYLACRFATEHLAEAINIPFHGVYKDFHGKPHPNGDGFFLSWSHAYPYAVSCIHLKKPVGIDIERPREQLVRASRKYVNDEEISLVEGNNLDQLCLIWAAKEAIFKMNGRSGLSLKDDITIESIENTKKKVLSKANINGSIKKISLDFFRMKENWVVYTR
jgi:4'-phosphopantetheinyl transferase